jgi:hypothetical protein
MLASRIRTRSGIWPRVGVLEAEVTESAIRTRNGERCYGDLLVLQVSGLLEGDGLLVNWVRV